MIFPIGDENIIGGHKPIFSYSLIIANVLVFLYELSLGSNAQSFLYEFGTIPKEISSGEDIYTLLTAIFLHGGWMHLIGNMLFLWIFADNIEAIIGTGAFVVFYFIGGGIASMIHVVADPMSVIPSVGASGAISAVMGTYLVMFPKSKVKLIFLLFFNKFELPAIVFLGFWFVQQLFSGIGSVGTEQSGGIAWWAHIGGFVFGLIAGLIIKRQYGHLYRYGH
jgi:membrane associated rhomboid family serine protease